MTPPPPSLNPSYPHRGLPWMSGRPTKNQTPLYPRFFKLLDTSGETLFLPCSAHLVPANVMSRHCQKLTQPLHTHTHTHTHICTHTLPLRPHCSVRPPASEMTIAIVAVHEEAAPHHHRLIIICCVNDS